MSTKRLEIDTIDEIYEKTNDTISKKEDLTLLILYLASWEEEARKEPTGVVQRAWRGLQFEILNRLEKKRLIRQFTNSVIITREGMELGKELDQIYQRRETTEPELN